MRLLGRAARSEGTIYLVGGASAVLVGWRETTVDIDMKLDPEPRGVFEAIARAKEQLKVNVELAAPTTSFQPCLDGETGAPSSFAMGQCPIAITISTPRLSPRSSAGMNSISWMSARWPASVWCESTDCVTCSMQSNPNCRAILLSIRSRSAARWSAS